MTGQPKTNPETGQFCARCGAGFVCGLQAGLTGCWCMHLPSIDPPLGPNAGCLCRDCLEAEIRSWQGPKPTE